MENKEEKKPKIGDKIAEDKAAKATEQKEKKVIPVTDKTMSRLIQISKQHQAARQKKEAAESEMRKAQTDLNAVCESYLEGKGEEVPEGTPIKVDFNNNQIIIE